MAQLKTTYKDDVLNESVNNRRKYNMIQNDDGTVSFEDVTEYSQLGDSFGAFELNNIGDVVNHKADRESFGSSSDLGNMPYYTLKKYWESIPMGFSCGYLGISMGYYIGFKESNYSGEFIVHSRPDLQDNYLRVDAGVFLVSITSGVWKLEKIKTDVLLSEWTD